jgi:hypothetical protein
MKTVNFIFSLRDALKGANVLHNLGFIKQVELTEQFELELDEDDFDLIQEELNELDIEFDVEFI